MKTLPLLAVAYAALLVAGCNNPPAASSEAKGSGTSAATPATPPTPKVPDALKTDGYYYYGLDNTKPLTYSMTLNGAKPADGVQTVQLTGVDKEANFTLSRTGSLVNLGDEELVVKPDGVYLVRSMWGPVEPAMMAFPDKATEGKTWKTSNTMKGSDDRSYKMDLTYTIGKVEKVKVQAGEFDALKVTSAGTLTMDGKSYPLTAEGWYSKQVGTVKLELKSKDEGGKEKATIVELKQVG